MANENCFQSREVTGVCDVCEAPADMMHLPTRPRGIYCEKHCPTCSFTSIMALVAIHNDRSTVVYKKDSAVAVTLQTEP
jgi:hypothetical protein